jgi:subtilase family serine protease
MRRQSRFTPLALVGLSLTLGAFTLVVTPALASEPRVEVANASPVPSADHIVHQTITTNFDVLLRQNDQASLTAYLAGLYDTASPDYHHFLSPSQFALRFGATSSTVSGVRSYLSKFGLKVGALSKGHILLHVTGSTSNIARAFATPVETVRVSGGSLAAQFSTAATLPARIAKDVKAVVGLSTIVTPTPELSSHDTSKQSGPTTCPSAATAQSASSGGGYTAQQQAQLYGLNTAYASGDTGVGQTIAAYELGLYGQSDLATFFSCYGLTNLVTQDTVDGGVSSGYNVGSPSEEATLDVEEIAALAPGATIKVYEGPNDNSGPTDIYQQIADDNTASIVTTSWGICEADPSGDAVAEQAIFEQMAAQGQTVVAAAGDSGSSDCAANSDGYAPKTLAVDDPASQPLVTGVGGLTVTSISPLLETVWNTGAGTNAGAGGGGVSTLWARPSWQSAPGITASETMRMVPDLSVMGDPATGFIEYYTGSGTGICRRSCASGWGAIGGTSIGAPIVSSLVAVAAQACGVSRIGFINPTLYAMATAGTGFNDVTTGNNEIYNVAGYSAGLGYDMASGLGSPNGIAFIDGLCPAKFNAAKSSFTTTPQNPPVNSASTVTAVLQSATSTPVANEVANVAASASAGRILIDGDASSSSGTGKSSYEVTTDATGTANVTVTSNTPGPVTVTITYAGQTIYTTTVDFTAAKVSVPGKPAIRNLTPLVGGFRLLVTPPASDGGSAITSYQYSVNSGRTWYNVSRTTRSVSVGNLTKARTYLVIVRARNAKGASASSAASRVTTLA